MVAHSILTTLQYAVNPQNGRYHTSFTMTGRRFAHFAPLGLDVHFNRFGALFSFTRRKVPPCHRRGAPPQVISVSAIGWSIQDGGYLREVASVTLYNGDGLIYGLL